MAGPVAETSVNIKPYSGDYFNGYESRKAATIVQLPEGIVDRYIDVLDARDDDGKADTKVFYHKLQPIARGVIDTIRERKLDGTLDLKCRKNSGKNCGAEVGGIMAGGFLPDDGTLVSYITVHMSCRDALIDTVPSNAASAAPEIVENAPAGQHLDMGCHLQLGIVAELTGQLMLDELVRLEEAARG